VWKEHLRPTGTANGDILTEFFGYPGYAAPYGAIDAAAGHHIDEAAGSAIRATSTVTLTTGCRMPGPVRSRPPTRSTRTRPTGRTSYSFWLASAVAARSEVTGDWTQARSLLPELVKQYDTWDNQFQPEARAVLAGAGVGRDGTLRLILRVRPVGPVSRRRRVPATLNAYQYGDAQAISLIAGMAHDTKLASTFSARAAALRSNMQKWLWDPARQFLYDMPAASNPGNQLLSAREEIGFVPWMFNMPKGSDSVAWKQLLDPSGFAAAYGPTTVEQRSNWFMYQASQGCCHWDGPSWPYATSQTLTAMANLLDNYRQSDVTAADYDALLHTYAATQYEKGSPTSARLTTPPSRAGCTTPPTTTTRRSTTSCSPVCLVCAPNRAQPAELPPAGPAELDVFRRRERPVPRPQHHRAVGQGRHPLPPGRGLHIYEDGRLLTSSPTLRTLNVHLRPDGAPGRCRPRTSPT